jgi:hypothetical protein
MKESEFKTLKYTSQNIPSSKFADFVKESKGFMFKTKKGRQLDKWEVWEMGYTDFSKLIKDEYNITAERVKT